MKAQKSKEADSPHAKYRFRSMDCERHGQNVPGCVPIESTKRGGKAEIPRCYACLKESGSA